MYKTFKIIFKGESLSGFDREVVKENFIQLCRVPPDQVEHYFTGREITLRKGLSQTQAQQYLPSFQRRGLQIYIREEADNTDNHSNTTTSYTSSPQNTYEAPSIPAHSHNYTNTSPNPQPVGVAQYYNHNVTNSDTHDLPDYDQGYVEPPPIFSKSLTGRYGRLNFANAHVSITGIFFLLFLVYALITYFIIRIPFATLIFAFIAWVVYSARAHALRLHDMNISEWFYAPIFITPLVMEFGFNMSIASVLFQFAVLIAMLTIPGTSGPNRFGEPSRQGKPFGIIILALIFALSTLLISIGIWFDLRYGSDFID